MPPSSKNSIKPKTESKTESVEKPKPTLKLKVKPKSIKSENNINIENNNDVNKVENKVVNKVENKVVNKVVKKIIIKPVKKDESKQDESKQDESKQENIEDDIDDNIDDNIEENNILVETKSSKNKRASNKSDKYTKEFLQEQFNIHKSYVTSRISASKRCGLSLRLPSIPEDITENIIKFIIINTEKDGSCIWNNKGDLLSQKIGVIECKSFTSDMLEIG
jgi:hypothetical protein